MPLPPIDYLAWAHAHHGRADLELASSGVPPAPADLLGPAPEVDDVGVGARFAEAVAQWLGVSVDDVVPALGTSQALWLAIASATDPGDVVAVEEPGYEPLVRVPEGLGRRVIRLARRVEDGWGVSLAEVDRVLAAGARLLVLTDLHNPTGVALPESVLAAVAARAGAAGALVLVDEVYRFFDDARSPRTTRNVAPEVIAIASLTKAFGVGWARAGWLVGPPDVVAQARLAVRHAVGIAPPAHGAWGLAALRRIDALRRRADGIVGDKVELVAAWVASRSDVTWVRPARGLFGFPELHGVDDSLALCRALLDRHSLLLGPGTFFGAPRHVRLSWGADRDRVARGLEVLGRVLDARSRAPEG